MDATLLLPVVGIAVAVGLLGIVVPVLPGLLLVWGAVSVYGISAGAAGQAGGWVLLAVVCLLYAAGLVTQHLVPGRLLASRGIPWTTTAAGIVLAIVGFFVVPVVGAVLGFVLGIFLVELRRLRSARAAWPSTVHALRAVGLSMLVELGAGLLMLLAFVTAVLVGVGR